MKILTLIFISAANGVITEKILDREHERLIKITKKEMQEHLEQLEKYCLSKNQLLSKLFNIMNYDFLEKHYDSYENDSSQNVTKFILQCILKFELSFVCFACTDSIQHALAKHFTLTDQAPDFEQADPEVMPYILSWAKQFLDYKTMPKLMHFSRKELGRR